MTIEEGDDTVGHMDMLLAKKRAADRRAWLERSGDMAEL
jgi:topoisomerase-4 subunit B